MSSMACFVLPDGGGIFPAGDELFENQRADQGVYWTQWNSRISNDMNTSSTDSDKHGKGALQCFDNDQHQRNNLSEKSSVSASAACSDCSTWHSEEQSAGPSALDLQHTKETNDIFMSQFSDDEMRMMDAPFQALDMFPDSMHRLLSYENMLSGVLTDTEIQEANTDHHEMDTMDTCGFPLFSHDLQDDPSNADSGLAANPSEDKDVVCSPKRSRSVAADAESSRNGEFAALGELEDVVFQVCSPEGGVLFKMKKGATLACPVHISYCNSVTMKYLLLKLTKKTRVCLRDAFYRLAESSEAQCAAANGGAVAGTNEQALQQSEGNESSITTSDRTEQEANAERETNAIDRTVAILAFKPPCSAAWE